MSRKVNPAAVGAFVAGGLLLALVAIAVLGTHRLGHATVPALLYFKDPVAGLDAGAPVEWSGVCIGQVEDIRIVYDAPRNTFRIPVHLQLDPDRIEGLQGRDPAFLRNWLRHDIAAGLRARLEMQSLITGKLKVVLVNQPAAPREEMTEEGNAIVIPTVSSRLTVFTEELGQVPLARIVSSLDDSLKSIARILAGLESGQAVTNLNATLAAARRMAGELEAAGAATNLASTLASAQRVAAELERARVAELAAQVRALTAEVRGQVAAAGVSETVSNANAVLTAAQAALADVRQQTAVLRGDLSQTARETAEAARAVRVLADYLEQHPEALLRGKKEK